MAGPVEGLEIGQAIDAIRAQLTSAVERAEGERLRFELGDIELEFSVSLTRDSKAEGGVKVWVLNVGGSTSESAGVTQKLKVTLKPKDSRTGAPPQVRDRSEAQPPN